MRTISENLKRRLLAQAKEANFQGLNKVAANLVHQAENNPTRQDIDEYVYSGDELRSDVEKLLWSAAIRTQDYYGKTVDGKEVEKLVDAFAEEFISSLRTKIGGHVVGPYEPPVPGETRVTIEIVEPN